MVAIYADTFAFKSVFGYTDPDTGEISRIRPGYISIDNSFAPPEIAENAGSKISWDRCYFEVGQVTTDNTRTTIRSWAGLSGLSI